jgi:hypothetical protein
MSRRLLLILLTLIAVGSVSHTSLAEKPVPPPLRAAILLRAIGYEKGFSGRSGVAVVAVVVKGSDVSLGDGKAVAAALAALGRKTKVAGRQIKVVIITHSSASETAAKLKGGKAEFVYLAEGAEDLAKDIPASEGGIRRIVACSHGSRVQGRCVLGVELHGEKPRLVVNLKQANAVGLRFQPELLRLARVIR